MRRLPPSSALLWCLVGSNAAVSQITVCENFSNCRTFSSEEDANRYMEEAAKKRSDQEQEIIRSMPIDYRDCILVALLDEIPKQKTEHIYLDRLDMHLRRQLERNGVNVFPGTAEPKSALALTNRTQHTHYWNFSFAFTAVLKTDEEYEAEVGFHCGTLCLSRTRYVLRRDGSACSIVSKQWLGGA